MSRITVQSASGLFPRSLTQNGFVGDSIVSDERVSENEDLMLVRRIGKRLRVADHASLKDDLTRDASRRSAEDVA